MVNNSTNINKMKNNLSFQLIKHKKTMIYEVGNSGPDLGQTKPCGRVKLVNGIPTLPFLIIG
jgi:hypothetical protein